MKNLMKNILVLFSVVIMFGSAHAEHHREKSFGIFGYFGPNTNMNFHPGMVLGWASIEGRRVIGTDFRFSWAPNEITQDFDKIQHGFVFWSLLARYKFSENDIKPFIGAGVALGGIYNDEGGKIGFSGHVSLGVDIIKFKSSSLRIESRIDFPFFNNEIPTEYHYMDVRSAAEKRYVVPITVGISYHHM